MRFRKWEELPPEMRTADVWPYYQALEKRRAALAVKRLFDFTLSLLMLAALSPLFLILAVLIKADSRGPVFFRQIRVTQYGRRFRIFKFRTMVQNAEALGSSVTVGQDARITRVGRVIRRVRLDELPQLIDVLRGTMTFVGTRPEVPKYVAHYTPEMWATLLLPAGVTSLTSIFFRDEAELLDGAADPDQAYLHEVLPRKMAWNLRGLEGFSFWNDISVMFMTFFAMCGKEYEPHGGEPDDKRLGVHHNARV